MNFGRERRRRFIRYINRISSGIVIDRYVYSRVPAMMCIMLDESDEEGRMADYEMGDGGDGVIIQLFGGRYG